jgi:hypothetical protein
LQAHSRGFSAIFGGGFWPWASSQGGRHVLFVVTRLQPVGGRRVKESANEGSRGADSLAVSFADLSQAA